MNFRLGTDFGNFNLHNVAFFIDFEIIIITIYRKTFSKNIHVFFFLKSFHKFERFYLFSIYIQIEEKYWKIKKNDTFLNFLRWEKNHINKMAANNKVTLSASTFIEKETLKQTKES